jgi:hypothetical protein
MSQDSVVEIIQPKSVPPKPGKRSRKFWVLVGAVVFIALTIIGVEVWPLRRQEVRRAAWFLEDRTSTAMTASGTKTIAPTRKGIERRRKRSAPYNLCLFTTASHVSAIALATEEARHAPRDSLLISEPQPLPLLLFSYKARWWRIRLRG